VGADTPGGRPLPGPFRDPAHPEVDDLLDDIAELALKMGGEVVVVPSDRMPGETGVAATYRF
jgi:hypothetical protein